MIDLWRILMTTKKGHRGSMTVNQRRADTWASADKPTSVTQPPFKPDRFFTYWYYTQENTKSFTILAWRKKTILYMLKKFVFFKAHCTKTLFICSSLGCVCSVKVTVNTRIYKMHPLTTLWIKTLAKYARVILTTPLTHHGRQGFNDKTYCSNTKMIIIHIIVFSIKSIILT